MVMNFQVCRCCLRENPANTYDIFATTMVEDDGGGLLAALLTCAPNLHLTQNDGLPDVICDHCFLRVHDTLDFRRRCEDSERELQRRYADTEHAIEEALRLVNLRDTNGQQAVDNLGCGTTLQRASELGPNELAMLDDLLQLEEYNLQRMRSSEVVAENLETPAFQKVANKATNDLQPLNDKPIVDSKLQAHESIIDNQVHQPASISPAQYTDSSASNTDSSPVHARKPIDDAPKSLHPCPECEKKFTRKFQLRLHMISVHKLGDGLQYECNDCQKTFASGHSLSYHQRSVHSNERPFACTHCDRRFVLRTQLSSHLRIHTGETIPRIFECHECGKRWRTKSDLRTHMRTHVTLQERPFKCNQCEKTFFTRGHLNSHRLVHSGEKPFACRTCGKSYQCVGNLNNHMARQHDFERGLGRGRSANIENSEL